MLGKIIQEEHRKINGTAKREKQTVDYIANLVHENYEELTECTNLDRKLSEEVRNRLLFDFVRSALKNRGEYILPDISFSKTLKNEYKILKLLDLL